MFRKTIFKLWLFFTQRMIDSGFDSSMMRFHIEAYATNKVKNKLKVLVHKNEKSKSKKSV